MTTKNAVGNSLTGATGSGAFVGATSPTLVTPVLGIPSDCKLVKQRVYTQTGAVATGSTILPSDDTIPQNNEGTQFMTVSITPTSSSNILEIRSQLIVAPSAGPNACSAALFQDTVANALAATIHVINANDYRSQLVLTHTMVAGTTSNIDFKIRAGLAVAGTLTFNGAAGVRSLGGVISSYIIVTEYQV